MICKELSKYIKSVCDVSDRVIIIQLSSKPVYINLLQVYALTANRNEEDLEKFHNEVKSVPDQLNSNDFTIVMGDLNEELATADKKTLLLTLV